MWGAAGLNLAVSAATLVMALAAVAGFTVFEGATMWFVVALVICAWLVALAILGARYGKGRWPFGRSDPYDTY